MSDRCLGRIIRWDKTSIAYFGGQSRNRFYLESRCNKPVLENHLCEDCIQKKNKTENEPRKNHYGLVTEPLPEDCHIFGSKWFESKLKTYGYPSESEMARAKQAQLEARKDVQAVVVQESVKVETKVEQPVKSKRGRKTKTEPIPPPRPPTPQPSPPPPAPPPAPVPPPPKPTSKRRTKAQVTTAQVLPPKTVLVQAIEVAPKLSDIEVVKIVVRSFQHNDTKYFRDGKKNKLYAVGKDNRPSNYIGRWDPDTETIDTDFPDSDCE